MRRLCLIAEVFLWQSSLVTAAESPHVLFIVIGDLNDWIGSLGGHPNCSSPSIDAPGDPVSLD